MINNYDSVETCLLKGSANSKKQESTSLTGKKGTLVSFMTVFLMLFSFVFVQGQTTLISPTGDGGFENGATFAANGWTTVNPATDTWQVGNVPVSSNGVNCAYVSANGGAAWTYSQLSVFNHVYRDVTIPAGENKVTLSFKWKVGGEGTVASDWDNMKVFWSPTSFTPSSTAAVTGATQLSGPGAVSGMYKLSSASWNTETIVFSAAPGTYRLIFQWKSDISDIVNPPAALDEISLVSQAPGVFISIANGNWSNPATWDANAVPTGADNATVAAHTVTIDVAGSAINNLTVQGSLEFGTTPTTFNVNGNLTLEPGAEFLVFNGTTGKAIVVSGNIVNDGNIDLSVGATTAGSLTLNGSTVQSITGSGTFANNLIRNLIFTNTSTAVPNINWGFDGISVAYNLNIANAKINLNSNKITFGIGSAVAADTGNTFTITNGGFLNGTFSRWWTATQTGYTTTGPTAIPTGAGGRYPFYSPTGEQRIFYIGRTTPTAGGKYAVTYNNATTTTTGLSIVDGAYTITNQWDGNFVVTLDGTTPAAASNWVTMFTPNAFFTTALGARITGENVALSGTHVNTSSAPYGQRSGVSTADLTSATGLYLGVNAADVPVVSIASGDWNATSTWNGGVVPTCADSAVIANGHTVTSTTSGNVARNVTIATGGTLVVSAGDLTVGCTLNNNTLANSGTLTVSGGLLAVNGNMVHNAASTFNQSGGDILVDGNEGGVAANSVASGVAIVQLNSQFINWTGGVLTILDPHANATASNTLAYTNSTAHVNVPNTHTLKLGDGVSTDAGGNATNGFRLNTFVGSNRILFGNLEVNTLGGTNRQVTTAWSLGFSGNVTIAPSSEVIFGTSYVAGNIVNNGTFTTTTSLFLANYLNGAETATTNAQTIGGTGVYRNLAAAPTANLTSLTVNNTNATGVTLNIPLSVSGTLTMTSGIINTTNTNLLTLGTATAGGTLAGTPSATNMVRGPFARTISNANANTNYLLFPVGKVAYAPVWAAPTTTTATVMKAETFDSNTGTQNAAIANMATNRRWELPLVSGTITDINVRVGDAGILATSIPVQAPSAAGEYTSTFGSVATAVAGVSTQSTTPVLTANYTGFLSYANSNACVGVPTPGNTIASSNTICLGTSVTLSLQNLTTGSGVSYQWFSSPDGVTYSPIAAATNPTYSTTPTASTYFMCEVTCATGPSTAASTPVQITFANEVTATVPATRCGTGTVDLSATPSAGATINWFAAATGGASLASGNLFTTPSISATTTYYAAATTAAPGFVTIGTASTLTGATVQPTAFCNRWPNYWSQTIYTAAELTAAGLSAGNITSMAYNIASLGDAATNANFTVRIGTTAGNNFANTTFLATTGYTTVYGPSTYTHTASGWQTITFATPYVWDGVSNIVVNVTHDGADAINNSQTYYTATADNKVLWVNSYTGATTTGTTSVNRLNVIFGGQAACTSTRVPVVATVSSPPALTLSAATATICSGDSSSAVTLTAGSGDYNTFVWSPATGVSGDEILGWTFNPTITTTYTLTATQTSGALCSTTATFTVNVNPLPTNVTITPAAPSICVNTIQSLAVTGGTLGVVGKVGSGVATNTTSTPFKGFWGGSKMQALYTPAELTALGMAAGQSINSIGYVALSGTPLVLNNFTINAGFVSNTTLGAAFIPGATNVVLAPTNYTPSTGTGNINFTLSTPLTWDGVSSLLIETCFNNNNGGGVAANSISVESTVVATGLNLYLSQDNNATVCTNVTAPTATTTRPNLRISTLETANITWSPVTNLFTDAGATIPYTGTNATTVYVQSATPGTTVYTATATIGATGCFRNNTVSVTVNALPDATVSRVDDVLTAAETGATYQWYTCAAGPVYTPIGGATSQSYTATAIGSYAVDVTLNGCTSRSTCFDVTTLGSSSFDMNALTVYPNPVVDILSIRYNEEITAINVYDLSGRLVKQITPNQTEVEVNMSELAAAMYIVKVNAGGNQTEIKVIKK
ncbi:Ig-like domain-containing protein [Flavobacterium cheniae]|uniref:Putative secreted protein (Por secretion system target) n=1 Tax=Flavobacterium cheniae TaxID=295428 RepID=A0A562KDQ8_9FLAO|nr:T9SS type A sorting domain-containing protein [Flavobacterium cheniae]TDR19692.1 putative secreted protein (Por secretion system target) [Flavobacterium cheniae]TWH93502.1 putative secreted protein (Por secretion system target) [Flavobacterium cheniae]